MTDARARDEGETAGGESPRTWAPSATNSGPSTRELIGDPSAGRQSRRAKLDQPEGSLVVVRAGERFEVLTRHGPARPACAAGIHEIERPAARCHRHEAESLELAMDLREVLVVVPRCVWRGPGGYADPVPRLGTH